VHQEGHHACPRYQALRIVKEVLVLPIGYAGMIVLTGAEWIPQSVVHLEGLRHTS
jgi:hypothetical protein